MDRSSYNSRRCDTYQHSLSVYYRNIHVCESFSLPLYVTNTTKPQQPRNSPSPLQKSWCSASVVQQHSSNILVHFRRDRYFLTSCIQFLPYHSLIIFIVYVYLSIPFHTTSMVPHPPHHVTGCKINGQIILEGQEVVASIDDRCLVCQCKENQLTCAKKTCPVLQCPVSKQKLHPNECCPRCTEQMVVMALTGKFYF